MSTTDERAVFFTLAMTELAEAEQLHDPINSAHEGYAVILEEIDEFWDECRRKRGDRDPVAMLHELVQVAAMAGRTALDLGLGPAEPREYSRGVGVADHVRPPGAEVGAKPTWEDQS